jgi:hypothetical protein
MSVFGQTLLLKVIGAVVRCAVLSGMGKLA